MVTVRAFAFALTIMTFVAISSYVYLNTQSNVSPTLSNVNQNQGSTTFAQQQISNQSVPAAPSVNYFGNHNFEPPSAVLISANTLVWTKFQLDNNSNYYVASSFVLFPFSDLNGANVIVAVYLDGNLVANSTTTIPNNNYRINSSLMPSSDASNSIFSLTGVTPTVGVGTQTTSAVSLSGTSLSFAIISDRPIWLAGWTQTDMSKGTGPQFGQSTGQLAGTYEVPETGTYLPRSLPSATITIPFELQISGDLMA